MKKHVKPTPELPIKNNSEMIIKERRYVSEFTDIANKAKQKVAEVF